MSATKSIIWSLTLKLHKYENRYIQGPEISGYDFTLRKRYRAEIERLERVNADIGRSIAAGEKDRNDLLKKCAKECNLRIVVELDLMKYTRKRGADGRFIKEKA